MSTGKSHHSLSAHNPLIKALSNSNLNDFDPGHEKSEQIIKPPLPKHIQSATDLLDMANDEIPGFRNVLTTQASFPPKRPPPPVPANPFQQQFKTSFDSPLVDLGPSNTEFGFDDDFSKLSFSASKPIEIAPSRPPPLPPMPDKKPSTPSETPFFTLGSIDSSESSTPMPTDPFMSTDPIQPIKSVPPSLPPIPPRAKIYNAQPDLSAIPPPLPPPPIMSRVPSMPPGTFNNQTVKPPPLPRRPSDLTPQQLDLFGNPVFNPTNAFDPFA